MLIGVIEFTRLLGFWSVSVWWECVQFGGWMLVALTEDARKVTSSRWIRYEIDLGTRSNRWSLKLDRFGVAG
jgi:hypothetical protein